MFIKVTKSSKNRYAQVVRAFRENGKIKHEVLLNLGRTDYLSGNSGMQKMALKLMEIAGVKEVIDINRAEEAQIVKWGDIVYQKLWHETRIGDSLNPCKGRETTWFDFKKTCLYLLTRYLLTPEEDNYYFTADIPINQFYRTLDILGQNKDLIEDELFPGLEKLTQPILCLLVPLSFKNIAVETLKQLDYDPALRQVKIMAMVFTDFTGRILSQEIFSVRRFGKASLVQCIARLRRLYKLPPPIIVTDQAHETELLQAFQYISSAPVDSPPDQVTGIHYGIKTNLRNQRPEDILKSHHLLEQFRDTLQPKRTHPSLQWTERRIKGHFVIGFLAGILENRLVKKMERAGKKASPAKIREALNSLQFARFQTGDQSYLLRISGQEMSPDILRSFKISQPQNIVPEEDFTL